MHTIWTVLKKKNLIQKNKSDVEGFLKLKILAQVEVEEVLLVGRQAERPFPQEGVPCLGERRGCHLGPSGACGASAALTMSPETVHWLPAGVPFSKALTLKNMKSN